MNLTPRLNLSTSHDGFVSHLFSTVSGLVDNEQSTSADCLLSVCLSAQCCLKNKIKLYQ